MAEDSKSSTFSFAPSIELWITLTPVSNDDWLYAQSAANMEALSGFDVQSLCQTLSGRHCGQPPKTELSSQPLWSY